MGRRGYPAEFRRKVLDLVQAERSVADVARARASAFHPQGPVRNPAREQRAQVPIVLGELGRRLPSGPVVGFCVGAGVWVHSDLNPSALVYLHCGS